MMVIAGAVWAALQRSLAFAGRMAIESDSLQLCPLGKVLQTLAIINCRNITSETFNTQGTGGNC